jgi:hypothetical protein
LDHGPDISVEHDLFRKPASTFRDHALMAANDPPPDARPPLRARRWSVPPPPRNNANRMLFRLIGIPALAFAGVLIYRGVQERFTLPDCDSARAKSTLTGVLDQLKLGPLREGEIKTISSNKQQIECNVALPTDGNVINVDYTFFWQGSTVDMRYSISRRPAQNPPAVPQQQAPLR